MLRRDTGEPKTDTSAGEPDWSAVWDGLPTVTDAHLVIRASRAGDLLAPAEPLQVA
ncbi:MAG: hypothetical protein ACRDJP_11730 [Actinomycetota bacterium]